MYSSITHHLYVAPCVHHPKSSFLRSPLTSLYPLLSLPGPLSLWQSPYHCLWGSQLSELFLKTSFVYSYRNFHIVTVMSSINFVLTSFRISNKTFAAMASSDVKPKSISRAKKWSEEIENLYRFQQAGYRDEIEYKQVKQVSMVSFMPLKT